LDCTQFESDALFITHLQTSQREEAPPSCWKCDVDSVGNLFQVIKQEVKNEVQEKKVKDIWNTWLMIWLSDSKNIPKRGMHHEGYPCFQMKKQIQLPLETESLYLLDCSSLSCTNFYESILECNGLRPHSISYSKRIKFRFDYHQLPHFHIQHTFVKHHFLWEDFSPSFSHPGTLRNEHFLYLQVCEKEFKRVAAKNPRTDQILEIGIKVSYQVAYYDSDFL
jgi:hypothetical protein